MSGAGLLSDEVGGQARQQLDGGGLVLGSEPVPDLGRRDDEMSRWSLQFHKNISPSETRGVGTMGMILARIARGRRCGVVVSRGPTLSSEAIEHLEDLTEALEIEEVIGPSWQLILRRSEIIGVAHGHGGMPPVGETDNELRIRATPQADDLDLLAAERMMGMGDGDQSRGRLGRRGSVPWASRRTGIAWRRWSTRRIWSLWWNRTSIPTPMGIDPGNRRWMR